ncbi:pentapeptide repeat-containing protein [Halobacteriovorax sp. HLS]|uniref:pentapeptide repeat-containing protein n=1 Tax=Halobacteriovorax sp. HLS TaxID=2234000 RepID=UPI0013E3C369|nr:pentapeptide repeat-containing protein [Halobacteriovorax sp. HLS]
MKTLTQFFNPLMNEAQEDAQYEVIENMTLDTKEFKGLSISGSLFSLTTFKNVSFESCVFYGSKIENCKFINCKFINCDFQFSSVSHSNFTGTHFVNCNWDFSPIRKSEFNFSHLDAKTVYYASNEDNFLSSCISNVDQSWEQAIAAEEAVVPLKQEQTATFTELLENFLFGKQAA